MAGIGFELRKVLKEKTLSSVLKAFAFAGVISSGPWIVSMLSILIAGYISNIIFKDKLLTLQFTIMVTYIIAFSLIISGFFQLSFTRYISDTLFKKEYDKILPTTFATIFLTMFISIFAALPFSISIYNDTKNFYLAGLFEITFIILSGVWIINIVLTGLKNYKYIVFSFIFAYSMIIIFILFFAKDDIFYFLLSFFLGNFILFVFLIVLLFREFELKKFFDFSFLKELRMDLVFIGFLINSAVWIDKIIFWYNPNTSEKVIGILRYSPIYDYPIFLAYLSLAPAMAMFLLRVETDFAIAYDKYYSSAREGGTLKEIYVHAYEMILAAKESLIEILRVQIIFDFILITLSEQIFTLLKIPKVYIPLFVVDLVMTVLQIFMMSIFTILFYLDKRKEILNALIAVFILNLFLTILTQYLGPYFYGYGASIAFLLPSIYLLFVLKKSLERKHYETFMFI